jgi:hypothetical protein
VQLKSLLQAPPGAQDPGLVEVLQVCRSSRISWTDMVLAPSVAGLFKWRQFEPEMILLAVGWYLGICAFAFLS